MLVPAEVGSVAVITKAAPPHLRTRMTKQMVIGPLLSLVQREHQPVAYAMILDQGPHLFSYLWLGEGEGVGKPQLGVKGLGS